MRPAVAPTLVIRDLRKSFRCNVHLVRRRNAIDNVMYGALGRIAGWRSMSRRSFPQDVVENAWQSLERVGLGQKAWQPTLRWCFLNRCVAR